jgi:UDP-N-acetylglucosamine--N-acetylmuramyl-(pentapeptide) pyrophosphoryl-undecaprenol N-acetylglucosamine transferase
VEGLVRILVSGGGTGGHVYPLLAVVEALLTQGDTEVLYVGSVGGMEADIVARQIEHRAMNLAYRAVDAAPIRGVTLWKVPGYVYRLWRGYRQSLRLLDEWTADAALVSGAYVSVPVALAARRRRIPVMVYLPDREPGLAVRLLSTFVHSIAVSFEPVRHAFPRAVRHKVWVSGYPVREALLEVASGLVNLREQGCRVFELNPALKTLLVMGGSRGARPINRALVSALPALLPECQVVHLTGQLDWPWVEGERARLSPGSRARYRAYPYLHEDLPAAMAVADLVVARAGAATLAEFPAVGLPSILVPYPYSGGHQEANADFMAEHGASLRLDDADLDASLEETVLSLFRDEPALERMREAAQALARPDAALQLARELCSLAGSSGLHRG